MSCQSWPYGWMEVIVGLACARDWGNRSWDLGSMFIIVVIVVMVLKGADEKGRSWVDRDILYSVVL
jgi:hypothetical protein